MALSLNYSNYFESKKRMFSAETKENIRFTLNKECLHALSSTSSQWKITSKEYPPSEEPVEFISHYIIVNRTGYPIDIFNAKGHIKNKIAPDDQQSFDVELGDNVSNDQNTLVSVVIKHPRA